MKIGLLGGSFNPAHGGHRRISLFARDALDLAEVWWLVSPGNPLKPVAGMAPLAKRFASACNQAGRAPIRVSAIEREFGTRYTVDMLRKLVRRWPKHRFIWLMGSDNLAQFYRWKDWRGIARLMPIAVIARPGYDGAALASPAMAWLRRFRRSAARIGDASIDGESRMNGAGWSTPALIYLRFDPDQRSATAIRRADSQWASRLSAKALRDGITRRPIPEHAA